MQGIEKAKEIIERGIKSNKNLMLYGDPDIDGMISLKIMCDYFDMRGVKYDYYVNNKRAHGFYLDTTILNDYLIVASDFSISSEKLMEIVNSGADIVSTDHHKINETKLVVYSNGINEGVIINNQYSFEDESEKYNSGAGVIYNVLCEITPEFRTLERDSMIGITLLSDVRPIENQKAKRYLAKLYTNTDGYIDYLLKETMRNDYGFGVPRMDRNYVDFTFSPTINALLRFNKTEEATNIILGKGKSDFTDYKTMQTELVKSLCNDVEKLDLGSVYIIALDANKYDIDISMFIGLVCSKFKDEKSTLGFIHSNGCILRASFRGKFDSVDYYACFNENGIHAEGHSGAFGLPDFRPNSTTWTKIADLIRECELNAVDTRTIIEAKNLCVLIGNRGNKIAYENCYVRDMYRTYIKYTGENSNITCTYYRSVELSDEDRINGIKPDYVRKGVSYKYLRDIDGNKMVKFREYRIDGQTVKSFTDKPLGLIMPILEKGYLNLYLV